MSVVCNVRAPYSGGSNFRQYFYGIWYIGHPMTSTANVTEIVPGEPLRRVVKPYRRVATYSISLAILDLSKTISWKWCKIRDKLILMTNRKSHVSFRFVPKSVTLNDLERRSGVVAVILRYFSEFGSCWRGLRKSSRSLAVSSPD